MSLVKQLWIAIAMVMALTLIGSMATSIVTARQYLLQQLELKNADNATSLALSLTQLDKDPVTVELQVSAQFDAGHYRFIRILSPQGKVIVERRYEGRVQGAPEWFVRLIPINAKPGQALIQDGWKQFGTLTLASHEEYVYASLWRGAMELLLWFALSGVLAGLIGRKIIQHITRPLSDVVNQAQAISERRWVTIPEPATLELRSVARGMNAMVERLQRSFDEEASRLEALRLRVRHDPTTGLLNRESFLASLADALEGEQYGSSGALVLVRIKDLGEINTRLGHTRTDALLKQLGDTLQAVGDVNTGQRAGRLNGGEFAVLMPGALSATDAARGAHEQLLGQWWPRWRSETETPEIFQVAAVAFHRDQPLGELLSRADEAMARAQALGANGWFATEQTNPLPAWPADRWREVLLAAITDRRFHLALYPVLAIDARSTLHMESALRLRLQQEAEEKVLHAGDFLPLAGQLGLTAQIDLQAAQLCLSMLAGQPGDMAINIAGASMVDLHFVHDLHRLLSSRPGLGQRLWVEVPAQSARRQVHALRHLVQVLKPLGCRIGIEYFDPDNMANQELTSLGIDYIKVSPSYLLGVADSAAHQDLLQALCHIAHSIGVTVIAQGVQRQEELALLHRLGFDGATGPGIAP